jgi:anti-anti-sigma regulatory factor
MLRINVEQNNDTVIIQLEGRIAGSSVVKLNRVWIEFAHVLDPEKLFIDMRNVTQVDAWGVKALRDLQALTGARLITSSPLTKYVAEDIARHCNSRAFTKYKGADIRRSRSQARNGTV